MFKRDEVVGVQGETIIARGVKVEGDFSSSGNVVIEGQVMGSVTIEGDLRVGEQAQIQADVKAKNAYVAGEIAGNIGVSEKLELSASSRVQGDVEAATLEVASGAQVNGRVTMGVPSSQKGEDLIEEQK